MKRLLVLLAAVCLFSVASSADTYTAFLSGSAEALPNASPGTGFTTVTYDPLAHTLHVQITFSDLVGTTTASHIHCCTSAPETGTAGVATVVPSFTGFPLGVTSGAYDHTFDLTLSSSWNSAFITANGGTVGTAEAALAGGLAVGEAYLNIHSAVFPSGEIRGFLEPVPEPATISLISSSLIALSLRRRRKK